MEAQLNLGSRRINDHTFELHSELQVGTVVTQLATHSVNLRDQLIHDALIKLGWTPPANSKPNVEDRHAFEAFWLREVGDKDDLSYNVTLDCYAIHRVDVAWRAWSCASSLSKTT